MIHLGLFILSYDLWFYVSHLILHTTYFYKKIHREHHHIDHRRMIFTDTYVSHAIESPFQGMGVLFPCLFIKPSMYEFGMVLCFINLRGMLRHDHRCSWLIGNHHLLHHQYPQYNFGEYWLDYIGGTRYPNKKEYIFGWLYL